MLMRMMPLDVMVPTTGGLTLTLPASGLTEKAHNPFGQVITIAGIKDEVVIMSSLQRPKKVCCPKGTSLLHMCQTLNLIRKLICEVQKALLAYTCLECSVIGRSPCRHEL